MLTTRANDCGEIAHSATGTNLEASPLKVGISTHTSRRNVLG